MDQLTKIIFRRRGSNNVPQSTWYAEVIMRMPKLRELAVLIGAMWVAGIAMATDQWAAGTIRNVYPMADGNFVITLNTSPSTCPGSQNPKYLWVVVGQNGVTAEGVKAMLATALTAAATEKPITLAFSDSTTYCYVNRFSMED